MKYIKLFESYNDILQDIKDILIDLIDLGFYVKVGQLEQLGTHEYDIIRVFIMGPMYENDEDRESFNASVYMDYDLRIKDYLGDKLNSVEYKAFSFSRTKRSDEFDEISGMTIDEELVCDYEIY
jgi:hypothetical protein